jgi:hypothetical protein
MKLSRGTRTMMTGVLAMALLALTPLGSNALEPGGTFGDDDGSVHEASIEAIADVGITLGCNPPVNDLYCPDRAVTREQMATFLTRALDLPAGSAVFTDTAGSVHEANISALAAAGITQGCNPPVNDMFCPDKSVTRAQMATFLTRALNLDASPRIVVSHGEDLAGVELGTAEAETMAELTSLFGPPTEDLADRCPYFIPDPNMRYVRWGSLIAVIRTSTDAGGELGLAGWRYKLDGTGSPEAGGPLAEHVELPYRLELLDPISDAADAGGVTIQTTNYGWTVVDLGYVIFEANGVSIDPNAPIDGVQQGFGFDCE